MMSAHALLSHQRQRDTDERNARTRYVIKLTALNDIYVGAHLHWVSVERATRFDFMTMALAHALDVCDSLDAFTIEAV